MHVEDIRALGHDNEDPSMEEDTRNNNHQRREIQNKYHHFDKVVKHIEIQVVTGMYLLKQYR